MKTRRKQQKKKPCSFFLDENQSELVTGCYVGYIIITIILYYDDAVANIHKQDLF